MRYIDNIPINNTDDKSRDNCSRYSDYLVASDL